MRDVCVDYCEATICDNCKYKDASDKERAMAMMMRKCEENVLGRPYFKLEDEVGFYLIPYKETEKKFFTGKVYIIDRYGTFDQDEEPSYDIMVEDYNGTGEPCLVKHVRQSECYILD